MHKLFGKYAHRYDLHTPPAHYQHDHKLVVDLALEHGLPCHMLDVGCGTGTLIEKARNEGIDAVGIDSAPNMVVAARRRLPDAALRVERMQDLDERERYDLIVCLSWSIHYCADAVELQDILQRMHQALVPGGQVLLQVAHGPNMSSQWIEDREPGPTGAPDDVVFRFRFSPTGPERQTVRAQYDYRCHSQGEAFSETHTLAVSDASVVSSLMAAVGFEDIKTWDSWRRDPFATSGSPFVHASRSLSR